MGAIPPSTMASHTSSSSAAIENLAGSCSHGAKRGLCPLSKAAGSNFCARHSKEYEFCQECGLHEKKKDDGFATCHACRTRAVLAKEFSGGFEHNECGSELPKEFGDASKENVGWKIGMLECFQVLFFLPLMVHTPRPCPRRSRPLRRPSPTAAPTCLPPCWSAGGARAGRSR